MLWISIASILVFGILAIAYWPQKPPLVTYEEGRVFQRSRGDWGFTVYSPGYGEIISTRTFTTQRGAHTAMRKFCSEKRSSEAPV